MMFLHEVENSSCLFAPVATGNGEWSVQAVAGGRTFLLSRSMDPRGACLEAARLTRCLSRHDAGHFSRDPEWVETT